MKKFRNYLLYLLSIIIITNCFMVPNIQAAANKVPSVGAHAYMIMDANSGKTLLSYNANKKIYPASTVKLMTALVSLDKLSTSKKIRITNSMLSQIPRDAAKLNLKSGSIYSVSNLLHMLLLPSAADAATSLAISSYGSNKTFIKQMNRKAKTLGLSKTKFDNTIGLDIGNGYYNTYTTAKDFTILARYAMSNSTIRNIVAKKSYMVPATKNRGKFTIKNTNQFYSVSSYRSNLYTIIGTKTGSTNAAGSVLIATAKDNNGHEVICSFFGNSTKEALYQDIGLLLNYTFKSYKQGTLSLAKGFYDTRFLTSNKLICTYYEKQFISGFKDRFYPKKKVTQKTLIRTTNKIAKSNLKVSSSRTYIKIQDFAEVLYKVYPQKITKKKLYKTTKRLKNIKKLSKNSLKKVCILYNSNVLPKNISKKVNSYLSREDMIYIAKNMTSFVKKYQTKN